MPCPCYFTTEEEDQYPLHRSLDGPWGQYGQTAKMSPPPGFEPQAVQPKESHYTDSAIPAANAQWQTVLLMMLNFHVLPSVLAVLVTKKEANHKTKELTKLFAPVKANAKCTL
jgi:hypothetical protein